MDIDKPIRWAEMREQIHNTKWVIQAIVAKHGDKMPGWGEWPALIDEAYSAVGKKWNEPVMVPIPFDPGWQAVLPPKPEKTSLPNSGPNGEIIFGTKKPVEDPNYALSISSISDDEEEEDDGWGVLVMKEEAYSRRVLKRLEEGEEREKKHESENVKVVVHIKDLPEGTRLEDLPSGTIVELDEDDIEFSDTPIGEESDDEVEPPSLKECLRKMDLGDFKWIRESSISLEIDVRIRAAYEVYEIDQDWDEFQDTCQRIVKFISGNNTLVLGSNEKIVIGEESDYEVEPPSLKECLGKMDLGDFKWIRESSISLEIDVRIRAAYEVYEIDQDWDEFQDTCQRIAKVISGNNTLVLGSNEKIGVNGIETRHIEKETVIPMDQIEVVITEKEGTIHPHEYNHVENVIAPAKTHIGAVLKQWSGSCQKHTGCVWDLLCDCSNCDTITARAGF